MATRTSQDADRVLSHGRGGAGNLATPDPSAPTPADFVPPALKSDNYTTGRGGTGNIAKNDPSRPEVARAAQDVDGPAAPVTEHTGPTHYGRGGAANVIGEEENKGRKSVEAKVAGEQKGEVKGEGGAKGLVAKVKGLLAKVTGGK